MNRCDKMTQINELFNVIQMYKTRHYETKVLCLLRSTDLPLQTRFDQNSLCLVLPPEEESKPVDFHMKAGKPLAAGSHHKESSDPSFIWTPGETQVHQYRTFTAHFYLNTQKRPVRNRHYIKLSIVQQNIFYVLLKTTENSYQLAVATK